jgi:hypothetical protein
MTRKQEVIMGKVQVTLEEEELKLVIVSIDAQIKAFEGLVGNPETPADRKPTMKRFISTYRLIENKLKQAR